MRRSVAHACLIQYGHHRPYTRTEGAEEVFHRHFGSYRSLVLGVGGVTPLPSSSRPAILPMAISAEVVANAKRRSLSCQAFTICFPPSKPIAGGLR